MRDLILADHDHVWHGWSPLNRPMPMLVRGRGTYLWDAEGKRYIDAVSSSMNAVCGYGRQRVVEAARRQMNELHHFDHSMGANAPAARLAQRIAQLLPGPLSRTFFANSGSEAVEAATRIALDYWANAGEQRTRVVTFAVGYHGCTLLARNLNAPRSSRLGPQVDLDVERIELPTSPRALRDRASARSLLQRFDEALRRNQGRTALVMVEPLLNVGGGIVLPQGFLRGLRDLCNEDGALWCVDEVFTGFGRTGRMFCFEYEGIVPDLVVMSKGISSGYVPLSAVTARESIYAAFSRDPWFGGLGYGHTTSGHAVACAVANEVLDIIVEEGLVEWAARIGQRLLNGLSECMKHAGVVDVRGLGLVVAVEFDDHNLAGTVADRAREAGLLLRAQASSLLALPALSATESLIDDIIDIFCSCFQPRPVSGGPLIMPLTEQQRSRVREGRPAKTPIVIGWRVEGTLDLERLSRALRAVVDRHDALPRCTLSRSTLPEGTVKRSKRSGSGEWA